MTDQEANILTLDGMYPRGMTSGGASSRLALVAAVQRLLHRVQTPTEIGMSLCWEQPAIYACLQTLQDTGIWSGWNVAGRGTKSVDEIRAMAQVDVDKNLLRGWHLSYPWQFEIKIAEHPKAHRPITPGSLGIPCCCREGMELVRTHRLFSCNWRRE